MRESQCKSCKLVVNVENRPGSSRIYYGRSMSGWRKVYREMQRKSCKFVVDVKK